MFFFGSSLSTNSLIPGLLPAFMCEKSCVMKPGNEASWKRLAERQEEKKGVQGMLEHLEQRLVKATLREPSLDL